MPEMKREGARRTGPALEAMYRFILWLVPAVEKFPRSQKFLLGECIQAAPPRFCAGTRLAIDSAILAGRGTPNS